MEVDESIDILGSPVRNAYGSVIDEEEHNSEDAEVMWQNIHVQTFIHWYNVYIFRLQEAFLNFSPCLSIGVERDWNNTEMFM